MDDTTRSDTPQGQQPPIPQTPGVSSQTPSITDPNLYTQAPQPISQSSSTPQESVQSWPSQQMSQPSIQPTQDTQTSPNLDPTPSRHVPDLTATQQVLTPDSASGSSAPYPSQTTVPPKQEAQKKPPTLPTKKGFPRFLLLLLVGFVILFIAFVGIKLFGSLLGGAGSGKVALTYWGLWEDPNVMQTVIADFERQNPNITVTYSKQDPHEYSKSVLTRIQNGTGPDIFRYHVSWMPMMLPSLLPLSNDAITKVDFTKAYYPVVQQDLIKNGAIYGVPLGIDTLALFVNKKMLADAKIDVPTTWDGFITAAQNLTKKDNNGKIQVAGAAMGTYDNITHAPDIISLLLVQNGVDLATMTPASNASDAFTFYTSFAKDEGNVWDTTLDPSLLAFERGNLAMYIGYSWDIFSIKAAGSDLDFAIYPVPHLPGRNATIASYWVEGVSAKTKHPKEAMAFMHFLAQKDTATKLYTAEAKTRSFGELYPRTDLAPLLKDNALIYPFVLQATSANSSYFAGETQDTGITATMNQYIGNAVNSMLKDTSSDTAVDTLTKGVAQVLSQYGQQ